MQNKCKLQLHLLTRKNIYLPRGRDLEPKLEFHFAVHMQIPGIMGSLEVSLLPSDCWKLCHFSRCIPSTLNLPELSLLHSPDKCHKSKIQLVFFYLSHTLTFFDAIKEGLSLRIIHLTRQVSIWVTRTQIPLAAQATEPGLTRLAVVSRNLDWLAEQTQHSALRLSSSALLPREEGVIYLRNYILTVLRYSSGYDS